MTAAGTGASAGCGLRLMAYDIAAATTLRHHFSLRFGTSPQAYWRTFRGRALAS